MQVPQYEPTSRSGAQPYVGPRYPRIDTRNSFGGGLVLGQLVNMGPNELCQQFSAANNWWRTNMADYLSIRIRITWPGYKEVHENIHVHNRSLGDVMKLIAAVTFGQFFANAPKQEKKDEKKANSSWNITANNLTLSDFALTGICHLGGDLFCCDIVRIERPQAVRRAF